MLSRERGEDNLTRSGFRATAGASPGRLMDDQQNLTKLVGKERV